MEKFGLVLWIRWTMVSLLLAGCSPVAEPSRTLTLATTTSTRDSGLLDVLVPIFKTETGIEVKLVAVGSGQAIELGRRGDADILLTHAPEAEEQFVNEGYALERRLVMHNDFVLVGPQTDPAGVGKTPDITTALSQIAESQPPFISRGDDSGTHMKERKLWDKANVAPNGEWYIEAGAGMAAVLRMASEKRAYTLSDRSTFLAHQQGLELSILGQGDSQLHNQYSVMVVSPRKHPQANHQAATRFADFLISQKSQAAIAEFGVQRYGQPLFFGRE